MAMRKKDFQAIARAIHGAREDVNKNPRASAAVILTIAQNRVCDVLAASNPRFDRARFIEACETGSCKGMPR